MIGHLLDLGKVGQVWGTGVESPFFTDLLCLLCAGAREWLVEAQVGWDKAHGVRSHPHPPTVSPSSHPAAQLGVLLSCL